MKKYKYTGGEVVGTSNFLKKDEVYIIKEDENENKVVTFLTNEIPGEEIEMVLYDEEFKNCFYKV